MLFLQRVFLGVVVAALGAMGLGQRATLAQKQVQARPTMHLQKRAPQAQPAPLSPQLQQALSTAKPDDRLHVIIRLKSALRKTEKSAEAQTSLLQPYLALDRASAVGQRAALIDALQAEAASAQASLQQFLASPDVQAKTDTLRPFWAFNGLALRATPAVISAIAQRDDVEEIVTDAWKKRLEIGDWRFEQSLISNLPISNLPISQSLISNLKSPFSLTLQGALIGPVPPPPPGSVEWGIRKTRADGVHTGLGLTGQGIVIANIDSGVDLRHPALLTQYRGYGNGVAFDHIHNWADFTTEGTRYPDDAHRHGTHTMGTMVGLNGIGVAPGAKWIACKGLESEGGLDSWLLACLQWMMAPNGEPGYAPDIVNNSWGNADGDIETNPIYRLVMLSLKAAGIFVVFSAGNSGPEAGTVGSPASIPEVIAVGATDSDDEVAWFSSRGPSPYNNALKPVLVAPGVRVISAVPGGVYQTFGGTSMAAPHVAGAAALLLQANPTLSMDAILNTLTRTAVPLSTTVPNNDSGYGRIDIYAAVLSVLQTGVLTGTVREKAGGAPIPNARVIAFNTNNSQIRAAGTANANGDYSIPVPAGLYTATASAFGFGNISLGPRLIFTNAVMALLFSLMELPAGVVRGRVRDAATGSVVTATVTALNTPKSSSSDNSCPPCRYSLDLPAGNYVLEARAIGYRVQTQTVSIAAGFITDFDFDLQPTQRIALVDSGAWYYGSQASYYTEALDSLHLAYDTYRIKDVLRDTPNLTQLLKYNTVIWSAPFDSPGLVGASETLSSYLSAGNNLLLSGQDVGLYDGGGIGYAPYIEKLNAYFRGDDAGSNAVYGRPKSLLASQSYTLTGGDSPYLFAFPDVLIVANRDKGGLIASYKSAEDVSGAGVFASLCFKHKSAFYSFGIEGINTSEGRLDVISRTLTAFDAPRASVGVELVSQDEGFTNSNANDTVIGAPGAVITHVLRVRNIGEAGASDTYTLQLGGNAWPTKLAATSVALKPCATANITVTVTIPPGAPMNSSDLVTITANSQRAPTATDSVVFSTKVPGSILLVDDERFYSTEQRYLDALAALGNTHVDRWESQANFTSQSPPLNFLRQYSMVVWFNGYDWFDPITTKEQDTLRKYLETGGRLFFSSQMALQYTAANGFDQTYLGVGSVDFADTITTVVGEPGNPLGEGLPLGDMRPFMYNWNLSNAVQPLPNTTVFLRSNSGQPAGLARQGISTSGLWPVQWRTAFLPFAFEALTPTLRTEVMNRVIGWLSWVGDSALVADRTGVLNGERVAYTLTLRADRFASTAPSQTVALSVPLAGGLTVVSSTLPNASANNAGTWRGFVRPGQVLTWTFEAQVNGDRPDHTPLTATLDVTLSDVGIRWTRDTVVRVAAPVLQASFSLPQKPKWYTDTVVSVRLRNVGSTSVPSLTLSIPVPTGLGLAAEAQIDVVEVQGEIRIPALATPAKHTGNLIVVQRPLAAGAEIEVTYPISIPRFGTAPPAFYCTARIETDTGLAMQAAQWLWPDTRQIIVPFVFKK